MKENNKEGKLVLEDIPIENEEMDEFKHNIFVKVLLELIKDIEEPCNIGLFGKWGVGKTSIAKMLSNKIGEKKKAKCIYFDAWKYSDESLRTQIILEMDEKLGNPIGKEKIIDVLYNIQEKEIIEASSTKRFLLKSWVFWISLAVMIAAIPVVHYIFPNTEITLLIATLFIVPLLTQLIATVQLASVSVSRRTILPGREWPGTFENKFKKMIENARYEKIVIVIDNLDRCQSETVIEMLALLKTFMDIEKCIYIIPCDEEALLSHINTIDKNTGYFKESGQEFLKKIFQVTIKIPPILGESIEEYAQKLRSQMRFQFDDNVQDIIVSAYAETPRQIIHAFNKLTTLYLLAEEKEKEKIIKEDTITSNLPFLAKISIIEDEWKDFYKYLSSNTLLLEDIENYFRGLPLDNGIKNKITEYFNENPELRNFLYATRTVRADNAEPFLLLSQETYESAILEPERFRLYLYRNNVERIQNIVKQLSNSEKIHHTKEILKLTKKAIQGRRFPLGFNCLNVLSYIYEILPEGFRPKVAREFGQCLGRDEMREFSTSFDYDKLFGIFPHMNEIDREDILTVLSGAVFSEKQANTALVSKFVEHSDIIGDDAKKKLNDVIIGMLDFSGFSESNIPIAEDVILSISRNETAKRNLFEQRLLRKVIDRITVDENGRQKGVDLYLQMEEAANQKTRERFISKELDFLAESAVDKVAKVKQVLDALLKFKLDEISPALADRLYNQLKEETRQVPRTQWNDYFRFIMKNFEVFSDSKKNDFLRSDIREVLTKGNQSEVNSVMAMALTSDVDILYDENILNSLLQRIPSELFQASIFEYLIRYVPPKMQKDIKSKLISILQQEDPSKALEALKAIENQFKCFEKTHSDEIAKVCIDKANKWKNHNQKDAALTPASKNFSELSSDRQGSVIDCIITFLKTADMRKVGKKHYDLTRDHLKKRQKERLASELLQGLINIPDEELNGGTKPLIEVLFDLKPMMKTDEIESFVRDILRMLKESLKEDQIIAGLSYLERFENFHRLKDRVKDEASRWSRSENEQISKRASTLFSTISDN